MSVARVSSNNFRSLDEFGFHAELAATGGTSVVMFSGAGCRSCRAWKQMLASYGTDHPGVNLFEVDAGQAQALASEFSVFHLPALFVYRDGHYHGPLQCTASPDALDRALAALLAAPAQEAP